MFAHKIVFTFFSVKDGRKHGKTFLEVVTAEYTKLMSMVNEGGPDEAQLEAGEEQPADEGPKKRRGSRE
jgi:hypothetical protein